MKEVETGAMRPQTKGCLASPESGRGKKNSVPEPLEEVWPC